MRTAEQGPCQGTWEKPPVLLQHGLIDSAATWVMNMPKQSLGFVLADQGYDVWLGERLAPPNFCIFAERALYLTIISFFFVAFYPHKTHTKTTTTSC